LDKTYTCFKFGKKLLWEKGVDLIIQTSTSTFSKKPTTTSSQVFYTPKSQSAVYKLSDCEGCEVAFDGAGREITFPTFGALVCDKWLHVKTEEMGWENTCNDRRLPNNKYFAFAKGAIDDGTKVR